MMKRTAASPVAAFELPIRTTILTSEELDGTLGGMPDPVARLRGRVRGVQLSLDAGNGDMPFPAHQPCVTPVPGCDPWTRILSRSGFRG